MSTETMLKGNELFQALSVEEVDRISALSSVKEFNTNDMIFVHDRPGTHIYVLMDGLVYLQLPSSIPEFSLSITKIEKGELFGLSPLLDSPRYTASAKCFAPTKVLAIEAKPVREILREDQVSPSLRDADPAIGSALLPDAVYNPYYYVLPDKTVKRFPDPVTHERYHDGRLSGKITCDLTTEGPLFIPDTTDDHALPVVGEGETKPPASHKSYRFFRINDELMLSGSELRGMISAISMRAFSFKSMGTASSRSIMIASGLYFDAFSINSGRLPGVYNVMSGFFMIYASPVGLIIDE